jgi:hypothetical protein
MLRAEIWPDDEHVVYLSFWSNMRGSWMTFGTRLKKAWEVLWYGETRVDDIVLSDPAKARALATFLAEWAGEEEGRRLDNEQRACV